jgi:hypothetical protein
MLEMIIALIALTLTLYAAGSIIAYSLYNGITPMPTSPRVRRKLLEIINERQITGKIFELGSGWGTLAIPLARMLPHCHIIAYENSSIPYTFSRFAQAISRQKNLKIIRGNFFRISLAEADLIVCYLYPKAMERLKIKFERELKEECLVISSTFAVPEWRAERVAEAPDHYRTKIYVYSAGLSPLKEIITASPNRQR